MYIVHYLVLIHFYLQQIKMSFLNSLMYLIKALFQGIQEKCNLFLNPCLTDKFYLERVQRKFLKLCAFVFKIQCLSHHYSLVLHVLVPQWFLLLLFLMLTFFLYLIKFQFVIICKILFEIGFNLLTYKHKIKKIDILIIYVYI